MILNNGVDVTVIGNITVDRKEQYVVKLNAPIFVNDVLVSHVIMNPHNFKEVVEAMRVASEELVVKENNEPVSGREVPETPEPQA